MRHAMDVEGYLEKRPQPINTGYTPRDGDEHWNGGWDNAVRVCEDG
jgi:hypothetical protein